MSQPTIEIAKVLIQERHRMADEWRREQVNDYLTDGFSARERVGGLIRVANAIRRIAVFNRTELRIRR